MADFGEIQRLKKNFGWSEPLPNEDGVRVPTKSNGASISFPQDSWDDHAENSEGMGIWAYIRLQEIHQLMRANKLSAIWEVGAGNGAVCMGLSALGHEAIAVEPIYAGAKYIANQGLDSFGSTLEELNLPDHSLPVIGVFDVLEHIEDTTTTLREFYRVLQEDGSLLITVPAHQFLFSDYDSSIGHFRRYSIAQLKSTLSASGFELLNARFLFSFLVPLAWLLRVVPEKLGLKHAASYRQSARSQFRIAQMLSPVFRLFVALEKVVRPPFGLSILAIAKPKLD